VRVSNSFSLVVLLVVFSILLFWYFNSTSSVEAFGGRPNAPTIILLQIAAISNALGWAAWLLALFRAFLLHSTRVDDLSSTEIIDRVKWNRFRVSQLRRADHFINCLVAVQFVCLSLAVNVLLILR
jgi:hypothetical protein